MPSDPASPVLSVVIPVFNRPIALGGMLTALLPQAAALERSTGRACEIIVADDGSAADVRERAMSMLEPAGRTRVTWVRHAENVGRSAARNGGAAAAQGERLLFLDGDSYVGHNLLERHCAAGPVEIIVGRRLELGWQPLAEMVNNDGKFSAEKPFEEDFRVSYLGFPAGLPHLPHSRAPWLNAYSHNISVPRNLFVKTGGFDEAMRHWGHEDIEIGIRLHQAGASFRYDGSAYCAHLPHGRDINANESHAERNLAYIKRKHPTFHTELLGKETYTNIERKVEFYELLLETLGRAAASVTADDVETDLGGLDGPNLWIGSGLGATPRPGDVVIDHRDRAGLLGFDTPFADRQFKHVINVGLWRHYPIADLCLAMAEGLRVGETMILAEAAGTAPGPAWLADQTYLVEALTAGDLSVTSIAGERTTAAVLRRQP